MNVLMPQLGETVAEGKIASWFKAVGDTVSPGENLFEIETDKVTMEIQATEGGLLSEIRVPEGETVKVGTVVAVIGGADTAPDPAPATAAPSAEAPRPAAPVVAPAAATPAPAGPLDPYFEVRTPERTFGTARVNGKAVTPLARRLAAQASIDLATIEGSGPHGRIVAADVRAAAEKPAPAPAAPALAAGPDAGEVMALYKDVPFEEVPLDGMRQTIAARLQEAKQSIPHFYIADDIPVGALMRLREEVNASAAPDGDGQPSYRLSLNDFIVKAWAQALRTVPAANAVWAGDRILRFSRSDVAVAVALDGGLLTPVLRAADSLSIRALSGQIRDLAERARARKLLPEEYLGGSSAVSNLGMYGVREFSAIINPPHGTILAVGATRRQAVETENGGVAFASMMAVTLSCDHRVVDGALGAELLAAFKKIVREPMQILL